MFGDPSHSGRLRDLEDQLERIQHVLRNVIALPPLTYEYSEGSGIQLSASADPEKLAKTTAVVPALTQVVIARTGTTTSGSRTVTGLSATNDLASQMSVTGTGIPSETEILTVDSASQVTLTQAATASGSVTLTYTEYIMSSAPAYLHQTDVTGIVTDVTVPITVYNPHIIDVPANSIVVLTRDAGTGLLIIVSWIPTSTVPSCADSACSGSCTWQWGSGSGGWSLITSACFGNGCVCQVPGYCGTLDCEHTTTGCACTPGLTPYCGTSTSSTTTTTTTTTCVPHGICYYNCLGGFYTTPLNSCACGPACCPDLSTQTCTNCESTTRACVDCSTTTTSTTTTTTTTQPWNCCQVTACHDPGAGSTCGPCPSVGTVYCTNVSCGPGKGCGGGYTFDSVNISGPYSTAALCTASCVGTTTSSTTTTTTTGS